MTTQRVYEDSYTSRTFQEALKKGKTRNPKINTIMRHISHEDDENSELIFQKPSLVSVMLSPLWSFFYALKWTGQAVSANTVKPVASKVFYSILSSGGPVVHLLEQIKYITPHGARDLSRIIANATYNFILLFSSDAAKRCSEAQSKTTNEAANVLSSPEGKQFMVEFATFFVKFGEVLDTPQSKGVVQQGTRLLCKTFDMLSSQQMKMFFEHFSTAICHLFEIANSQEFTILLSEATANIVYALETKQHHESHTGEDQSSSSDSDESIEDNENDRNIQNIQSVQSVQNDQNTKKIEGVQSIKHGYRNFFLKKGEKSLKKQPIKILENKNNRNQIPTTVSVEENIIHKNFNQNILPQVSTESNVDELGQENIQTKNEIERLLPKISEFNASEYFDKCFVKHETQLRNQRLREVMNDFGYKKSQRSAHLQGLLNIFIGLLTITWIILGMYGFVALVRH